MSGNKCQNNLLVLCPLFVCMASVGWPPFVKSWLQRMWPENADTQKFYEELFEKLVKVLLVWKDAESIKEPVPISDFEAVRSLCQLFETLHTEDHGLAGPENKPLPFSPEYAAAAERWFVFAVMWSLLAAVDNKGRLQCDTQVREIGVGNFPASGKIFDYFVDSTSESKMDWQLWDSRVPSWIPESPTMAFAASK